MLLSSARSPVGFLWGLVDDPESPTPARKWHERILFIVTAFLCESFLGGVILLPANFIVVLSGIRDSSCLLPIKIHWVLFGNMQLLSRIPDNTTIKFAGNKITPSNHVKNLGLYIDRYMTFDVHINELNKKVMGTLMYINRLATTFRNQHV